jgi:uncharacterized protein YaiE (UPF0345 family)
MRHNRYYEDKVQSLGFEDAEGAKTVGVIEKGEYAFESSRAERMTVISGELWYRLPGRSWLSASGGDSFDVPPGVTFHVKTEGAVSYLCRYW